MTKRQISLLERIVSCGVPIKLNQLAKEHGVGLRTVQNDIASINYELKKAELPAISTQYGKGVFFAGKGETEPLLDALISSRANGLMIINNNDRLHAIYQLFLFCAGPITLDELAIRLNISRGTVINDLKRLRAALHGWPISISSSANRGNRLFGQEVAIRNYAICQYIEQANASFLKSAAEYHRRCVSNLFYSYRSKAESRFLYLELQQVNKTLNKYMTDSAFLQLISSLEIALERVKLGKMVTLPSLQMESITGTDEFKAMYALADAVKDKMGIALPPHEIGWLTMLLLENGRVNTEISHRNENYVDVQVFVCHLISRVEESLGWHFSQDNSLYNDLVYHIRPAIYRIQHNIRLKNHLGNEVQIAYPEIYEAVQAGIRLIENQIQSKMPKDEVGLITLHFASVFEKQKRKQIKSPTVLVVCDSGIGTSNLLVARLTSLYDVTISDVVAFYNIEPAMQAHNADFILSTLDIAYVDKKVLLVSPLLNKQDIRLLDRYFQRRKTNEIDQDKFFEILGRYAKVQDPSGLKQELCKELSLVFYSPERKDEQEKMLADVVAKEMIQLDYHAENWQDAVRHSGKLLMQGGCVNQDYVDSMVNTVKEMGCYIVISKGIALPHSRSGQHAYKVGISFLRLAQPVAFGHPENDPVDLVFALSSVDNKAHLRALRQFTRILTKEENIEYLRSAETVQQVFEFLCKEGDTVGTVDS